MPLSVALIADDVAEQMGHCLANVAFAGEIIVVAAASTHGTVEPAARHGERVSQGEWLGFGAQKRIAVEAVSHDGVLWVDADERVSPESVHSTCGTKQ